MPARNERCFFIFDVNPFDWRLMLGESGPFADWWRFLGIINLADFIFMSKVRYGILEPRNTPLDEMIIRQ